MSEQRMVILTNTVNGNVSVNKPSYGVRRLWTRVGQSMALPYDVVEQLLYDPGFENMIRSGILYIKNMQDKIDLGLEPAGAVEPENIIVLDKNDINRYWNVITLADFKDKVSKLPMTQIDALVEYAVSNEILQMDKAQYIKDLTKKDILSAINRKHQSEEIDRRNAEREKARRDADEGRRV